VPPEMRCSIDGRWPMFDAMMMPWSMSIVQYCNVLKLMFMICSCYVHVMFMLFTQVQQNWNRVESGAGSGARGGREAGGFGKV